MGSDAQLGLTYGFLPAVLPPLCSTCFFDCSISSPDNHVASKRYLNQFPAPHNLMRGTFYTVLQVHGADWIFNPRQARIHFC